FLLLSMSTTGIAMGSLHAYRHSRSPSLTGRRSFPRFPRPRTRATCRAIRSTSIPTVIRTHITPGRPACSIGLAARIQRLECSIPSRSMWSIDGAPGLPNPAPPIYQLLYPLPPQGNLAARYTRFVQMDDVAIGRDGTVIDPSGNTYGTTGQPVNNVQRDGRYSW